MHDIFCILGEKRLFCYQCIREECIDRDADSRACKDAKAFVIDRLIKESYDISPTIPDCPKEIEDVSAWSLLQIETQPCPNKDSVCSLEKVEVAISLNDHGTARADIKATVLGCASQELKTRMKERNSYGCNITKTDGTFGYPDVHHFMRMEHCSSPSTECKDKDWCVEPSSSAIKKFTTPNEIELARSSKITVIIGIGVACVILFLAWGACQFCNLATRKTSSIPKSGLEDTDSVIVVKNKSNSRREYELPQIVAHKKEEEGITILSDNS